MSYIGRWRTKPCWVTPALGAADECSDFSSWQAAGNAHLQHRSAMQPFLVYDLPCPSAEDPCAQTCSSRINAPDHYVPYRTFCQQAVSCFFSLISCLSSLVPFFSPHHATSWKIPRCPLRSPPTCPLTPQNLTLMAPSSAPCSFKLSLSACPCGALGTLSSLLALAFLFCGPLSICVLPVGAP